MNQTRKPMNPRQTPKRHTVLRLLPIAMLVSACGGGSSGDGSNTLAPILVVGHQTQRLGTATRSTVYVTPTASTPNNTLAYSFVQNTSVLQAAAGAPAGFDVHTVYTYTVTQDPGTGIVPISQTVDAYENLVISGATQSTATVAQQVVQVSNDETSNALGGGPFTQTYTTSTTYANPRSSFPYPLQTGATMTVPQGLNQTGTFTDLNAAGAAPANSTNQTDGGYSITYAENSDGSHSYQIAYAGGGSLTNTEHSDGSGSTTYTGATSTTATTIGLPATSAGVTTIPVGRTVTSTTTTTTNHAAADWYPNGGAPSSPLVLQSENVVGPAASLPAACNGAVIRPDIYEIDTTTTTLNTVDPSYAVTTTRAFNADGVNVCSLSTETASTYNVLTGALISTTTTTTATLLNTINY